MRAAVIVFLLLMLVAISWFAIREGAEPDPVDEGVRRAEGIPTQDAPRLEGAGEPAAGSAETIAASRPGEAPGIVELRGQLTVEDGGAATVEVTVDAPTTPEHAVAPDTFEVRPGAFALDVTRLVRALERQGGPAELRVRAHADGYVDPYLKVPLPAPKDLLAGSHEPDRIELHMRRPTWLGGVVLGPEGLPRSAAEVRLYAFGAEGPERSPVAHDRTDEDGRFRLACAQPGRHLLAAAYEDFDGPEGVMRKRLLPGSVILDVHHREDTLALALKLGSAHEVRGEVHLDGAAADHASVGWRLAAESSPLFFGTHERFGTVSLHYVDGKVHWGTYSVRTDAHGQFRVVGLSDLPYRFHVDDALRLHVHRMSQAKAAVLVRPPANDVRLELLTSSVVIRARFEGRPVPSRGKSVHLSDVGMHPELPDEVVWGSWFGELDAGGTCRILLTPHHTYFVRIHEPGYEPYWKDIEAPAAGKAITLDVDLVRAKPKPSLVVTLEGEGADEVETAGFGFHPIVDGEVKEWAHPVMSRDATDGRFVLEDLVPGPHRLVVRPGRAWYGRPTDWLEAETTVTLPPEGEARVTVQVARGGRLLLESSQVA